METKRLNLQSLSAKIIILCGVIALVGMSGVVWMNALRALSQIRHTTELRIHEDSRFISAHLERAFYTLREDTEIISISPDVIQITDFLADPSNNTDTINRLHRDIEASFINVMERRPNFSQIRIVGLEPEGREIVRVNRNVEGLGGVPPGYLQNRGDEPYMHLARDLSVGQVSFSSVSLNPERGESDESRTPTIRSLAPIGRTPGRAASAAVIINADYADLFEDIFASISVAFDTLIIDQSGDVFQFNAATGTSEFYFREDVPAELQRLISNLSEGPQDELFQTHNRYFHSSMSELSAADLGVRFNIIQSVPPEYVYAGFFQSFMDNIAIVGLLLLLVMALGTIAAFAFTTPLRSVTNALKSFNVDDDIETLNLPYSRDDEIGDLSRTFHDLLHALANERAQKQEFFEHGVEGFVIINARGEIQIANAACQKLFGYKSKELIGKNVSMLMPDEHRVHHNGYLKTYLETGKAAIIGIGRDVEAVRKDGSAIPIGLSLSRFYQNGEVFFCGSMRDISERKQMEKMKNEFVSTVNHELRTPLTSIYGSLDLLRQLAKDQMDEKCNRLINIAHESCGRLTSLVNDILDLEKIAAGKMEYKFEGVSIQSHVSDIASKQESLAHMFHTRFEVHHSGDDAIVKVDRNRLTQALVNLLSNAAKFSPEGYPVEVRTERLSDETVRVSVRDFGSGIPEAFQKRIFEKFAQADGSSKRKAQGSGLGLNITKTIVEAFGGTIHFKTAPHTGTTFYFDLPVSAEENMTAKVA